LIKSIDRFDFAYDVKFSTYAVPLITGEIRRFLRDDGMIKVSRRLKENGGKIHQAREKLMHQHGREPSMEEISRETNLSEEEILLSMEANVEVDSLNRTYESAGKEVSILEYIPAERDLEEELVEHLTLKQAMKILDSKEKILIRMRYYEDKTQTEAARHFGVSQVQISRMEKKILSKLKKSFE
jgi:RNA polymerase sporulation-specific sigma factor